MLQGINETKPYDWWALKSQENAHSIATFSKQRNKVLMIEMFWSLCSIEIDLMRFIDDKEAKMILFFFYRNILFAAYKLTNLCFLWFSLLLFLRK